VELRAVAEQDGREERTGLQVVAYPHVERRQLARPAVARVRVLDAQVRAGTSVGYVMGAGDEVAESLRQLGASVALLTAEDLAAPGLERYSTIVTGVRAYESRADLRALQGRLMAWVSAGGHLVVQYNREGFNHPTGVAPRASDAVPPADSPFAPFPARVGSRRVSDETAPVRALVADHPLLVRPNRLGPPDWEGWVQERGLQLLDTADPRYVDLLAAADPFPLNPGEQKGLLVEARVGRGTWTYVGLALFRQAAAGVPGAYRLLGNLVSRPPAAGRAGP
jgi:hypothetical protein